jgi:hypothetical protein
MPEFNNTNRRLVLRYGTGPAFSFNAVRLTAGDQGAYDLAQAIGSIQAEQPQRVTTVLTRQLF